MEALAAYASGEDEPKPLDDAPSLSPAPAVASLASLKRPAPAEIAHLARTRYVSKRERVAIAEAAAPAPSSVVPFEGNGPRIAAVIREPFAWREALGVDEAQEEERWPAPTRVLLDFAAHERGVNWVEWNPRGARLLASAGNDGGVQLWDVSVAEAAPKCVRVAAVRVHTAALVKAALWRSDGLALLSLSADLTAALTDIEAAQCVRRFAHTHPLTCGAWHPSQRSVFVTGSAGAALAVWDVRQARLVREMRTAALGPLLSLDFLSEGGAELASSAEVTRKTALDKAVCVWDFASGALLSNQVYVEAFTCPTLRRHPSGRAFALQSNGDYVALCSTAPPYRLNKARRCEGHRVAGNPIGLAFSADGALLCSGSADGRVVSYAFRSARVVRSVRAHRGPVTALAFHPARPSLLASASWDGRVALIE